MKNAKIGKLAGMLALVMLLAALSLAPAGLGESVTVAYVDAAGVVQTPKACTQVVGGNENKTLGNGWYAVTQSVSFSECVVIIGSVDLILCDGATLYANDGIYIPQDATLTIWAQSTGDNKGGIESRPEEGPGIGGGEELRGGGEGANVTITGGTVIATGYRTAIGCGGNDSVMGNLAIDDDI